MIDLTTDAKNNIKKREPIIPLSPCFMYMYMYMYKYTVWAIPIPNFNCPFIIPKEKKQFHDNNNNNNMFTARHLKDAYNGSSVG